MSDRSGPIRFAVISGKDNATVLVPPTAPFAGSEDFTGGGFVAAADLNGDGKAEWVITPDQGIVKTPSSSTVKTSCKCLPR